MAPRGRRVGDCVLLGRRALRCRRRAVGPLRQPRELRVVEPPRPHLAQPLAQLQQRLPQEASSGENARLPSAKTPRRRIAPCRRAWANLVVGLVLVEYVVRVMQLVVVQETALGVLLVVPRMRCAHTAT